MPESAAAVAAVAQALLTARQTGQPADDAPLAASLSSPADAYAVQDALAAPLGLRAGVATHWKSGGPSRTTALTHAPLPPAGVWASPARLGTWPFRLRGIEAEVALRLAVDVDATRAATLTLDTAVALVDAMAVSIELVDSRWAQGFSAPALLRLADLQSHAALVLGHWVPFAVRDWSAQQARVTLGSQAPQVFTGSHSCGDPAWVLADWLRHATRHGAVVPAGTVVTTGTWCGLLTAQAGDRVTVAFDGIGEASVQL